MIFHYTYDTMLGSVTFVEEDGALLAISTSRLYEGICQETDTIKEAHQQLTEYLKGERKTFDLPLNLKGTDFQKQVWMALCDIPYGETRSYKQIAESIGNPKAVRAVGMANNRNPLLIVVPCHRVIGANGKLVGYGAGIEKKEFLLRLEKSLL
jgi:methylated-DNA-[protein]-cysteine S-methyltransferase